MTKEIHDINTKALDFVVELIDYIFDYPDDDYMTMECLCRKLYKHDLIYWADGHWMPSEPQTHDIRTNTHECVKDTHEQTEPQRTCDNCGTPKNLCIYCIKEDRMWQPKDEPNSSEKPNNSKDGE